MKIKVVVADDHELIREGIVSLLSGEADIEIMAAYSSGTALLSGIMQQSAIDVVLLDLQLAAESGSDYLLKIKQHYPEIKVLILSSNENIHNVSLLIKSGASGYLFKNTRTKALAAGIRHVMQSDSPYLLPKVAKYIHNKTAAAINTLTPRELYVLQLIAQELTSQEIGARLHLSQRTMESYRLMLMQKLDVKNMVGMVKKAIMLGLIKE